MCVCGDNKTVGKAVRPVNNTFEGDYWIRIRDYKGNSCDKGQEEGDSQEF